MKKFIRNLIIFLAVIAVIVGLINGVYLWHEQGNFGTMGTKRNDDSTILTVPEGIQLCNFGSSHGLYDFDYSALSEQYTCFNFGLPSQTLSYDARILENYSSHLKEGAVVIIPVSHFSFFGKTETEGQSFASKNKRYYRFLDPENIKEYDLKTDILVSYLPALTVEDPIALVRKLLSPRGGTDLWCTVTDEAAAKAHAAPRYKNFIESKKDENGKRIVNQEEIDALYRMLELCDKNGYQPVLVTTPYLDAYNEQVRQNDPAFYDEFYDLIRQVTEKTGAPYYDYSEDARFATAYDLFFNTDHLNRSGAAAFTSILYEEVLQPLLP